MNENADRLGDILPNNMTESIEIDTSCDFESTNKLLPFTARNMPKYGLPLIHMVMIKNANFFMVIVSLLRTHQ